MPGRLDSSTSRIFYSTVNRRRRCTLVITWSFSFVILINLGVCLGPQAMPRVRSKRRLLQPYQMMTAEAVRSHSRAAPRFTSSRNRSTRGVSAWRFCPRCKRRRLGIGVEVENSVPVAFGLNGQVNGEGAFPGAALLGENPESLCHLANHIGQDFIIDYLVSLFHSSCSLDRYLRYERTTPTH